MLSKSSVRFIDVAGTMAFARIPLVLGPVIGLFPSMHHLDILNIKFTFSFLCSILFSMLVIVWTIIWYINAYKVSCNLSGQRLGFSFSAGLIVAELISKLIIIPLIPILMKMKFLSLFLASFCLFSVAQPKLPNTEGLHQKAAVIMQGFQNQDFTRVIPLFDETMKQQLPATKLKEVWAQLSTQAGSFKSTGLMKDTVIQGYRVVLTEVVFEHLKLNMQAAFNSNNQVCGLYFIPFK